MKRRELLDMGIAKGDHVIIRTRDGHAEEGDVFEVGETFFSLKVKDDRFDTAVIAVQYGQIVSVTTGAHA